MAEELTFADLVAPVTKINERDPLKTWRWLVGTRSEPLLLTALGDLFVTTAEGRVQLLDTYAGKLIDCSRSYQEWKTALQVQKNLGEWFLPELVIGIKARGIQLAEEQCYSPIRPPILGGQMTPDNFEATSWVVHINPMGQIHEQVSQLPEGTPISGIDVCWDDEPSE
jgi:hypothetical protein